MNGMMNSINQIAAHNHGLSATNHPTIGVGAVSSPAANSNNN
jgi:hypothetical protein